MEMELSKLYDVIHCYKEGLIQLLNKIEDNVSQAVSSNENYHTIRTSTKKYIISMEIMEVLQTFVKMTHTCEKLNEEFILKVEDLGSFNQVDRNSHSFNPFVVEEIPELLVTKENKNETNVTETTVSFAANNENVAEATTKSFLENNEPKSPDYPVKLEIEKNEDPSICVETRDTKNHKSDSDSSNSNCGEIPFYDRRREATKLIENSKLKKVLKWNLVPAPEKPVSKIEKTKYKNRNIEVDKSSLQLGQNCVICHIESPSEFYVRLDEGIFEEDLKNKLHAIKKNISSAAENYYHAVSNFESRFDQDMNRQHQYVVNKYKTKQDAKNHLGNFCVAFYPEKQKWFRLEVLDWMMQEAERVFVQLIDHGVKLFCTYKYLKFMSDLYRPFSKMAIKCHLAGVYSPSLDKTKWPESSINFFVKLSEMPQKTQFMVIFVQFDGISNAVELRKSSDPNADSLGELLVKNNHAFEMKLFSIESSETTEEDFEEYDNINEAITGYDARDETRICPFAQRPGGCFKGPACKLEHKKLSEDGITTDKLLILGETLTQLVLPPVGECVEILITGYINTCHFYANILNQRTNDGPFDDVLQRLMEVMKTNSVVQTYESFKMYPGIGELVLVEHELEWYRGRCVGYTSNQEVEVFFVDMGYCVEKKLKDLKQMKEDFLHVPFQAVECVLHDCQEKQETISSKRDFFDQSMFMKVFRANVVESSEPLRLVLWDADGMDMSQVLELWGLVERRKNDLYPDQRSILTCI